jgi:hypothetical protein
LNGYGIVFIKKNVKKIKRHIAKDVSYTSTKVNKKLKINNFLKYNETTNVRDTPTKKKIKLQFHINS